MKKKVHVVSYTHWDREFRWEFELTRMKLVDCIDHLLDIMTEQPEYRSFLMDGQIGLLDDYLEIRPEKEGLIREEKKHFILMSRHKTKQKLRQCKLAKNQPW